MNQNASLQTKITHLESTLASRDQEWILMDSKYRKYLEKAKEVIKSTEPHLNGKCFVKFAGLFHQKKNSMKLLYRKQFDGTVLS